MTGKTTRFVRLFALFGLLMLVPLLAACAQSTAAPTDAAADKPAAAAGPMTLKLVEPTEGAEVPAGTLTVRVETTGLEYTMPGNENVAGQGHVHFTLDDRPEVMSTEPQAELNDVTPGTHTLKAELVQNNTEPFDPPIEQVIEFTAK